MAPLTTLNEQQLNANMDYTFDVINACMNALARRYSARITGMQDCRLFHRDGWPRQCKEEKVFLQILKVLDIWILVTNYDCVKGHIHIYVPFDVKIPLHSATLQRLCYALNLSVNTLIVSTAPSITSSRRCESGPLAVITAILICKGTDPKSHKILVNARHVVKELLDTSQSPPVKTVKFVRQLKQAQRNEYSLACTCRTILQSNNIATCNICDMLFESKIGKSIKPQDCGRHGLNTCQVCFI